MPSPALRPLLASLEQRAARGVALGLDRVERALAELGSPERAVPVVHVAGTNGKGSVSAMTEAIARTSGLRTGLYTSPHLCKLSERIRINGDPIDDASFANALERVESSCSVPLTFFEILTVTAFVAFAEAKLDLVILEVGLGGRLDATNVVRAPLATAITSIAFDHTEWLGSTLSAIATEKAGILKPGAPVVLGPLEREAEAAIDAACTRVGTGTVLRVSRTEKGPFHVLASEGPGGRAVFEHPSLGAPVATTLSLLGAHQVDNAAVATGIAIHLSATWPALPEAIGRGLATTHWPGRMERIAVGDVTVVLDCAHNPHGADALAASLSRAQLDPARTALVFGALADKPWRAILGRIAPFASRRYYAEPKGRVPAPLTELSQLAEGVPIPEPRAAIRRALAESAPGDTILVSGSIYLVGEVRAELLGIEADPVIAL